MRNDKPMTHMKRPPPKSAMSHAVKGGSVPSGTGGKSTGQPEVTFHLLPVASRTGFRVRMGDLYSAGTCERPSGPRLGCLEREGGTSCEERGSRKDPWGVGTRQGPLGGERPQCLERR